MQVLYCVSSSILFFSKNGRNQKSDNCHDFKFNENQEKLKKNNTGPN